MEKMQLSHLDLDIYKEVLDNGLIIYVCPMKKNDTHASIVTKFGNDNLEFVPRGKKEYIKVPDGTAHFLEHKMFEMENGEDPMTLYSNNGASSNAYTTSNVTRYYFTGATHFYENLKILLDCITNPYFTKENIKKEQGIITQEINSGLDDPEQAIYYLANKNLFIDHPHKYMIAGTVDSISKLTPEILYDCYNTFYNPSNMYMVITGNVDVKKTINYIKKYYKNKQYDNKDKITIKKYDEIEKVKIKKAEEKMDITNKLLTISYKVKKAKKIDSFLQKIYILIYLDGLFSEMSDHYLKNYKDKNILNYVSYFIEEVDQYIAIHFEVEVLDKETILSKINKDLNKKTFSKEDFNLIVKNLLNSSILSTESVEGMSHIIVNQELLYGKIYNDFYDKYKNLDFNKYKKYINSLDFSNYTIGIIKK